MYATRPRAQMQIAFRTQTDPEAYVAGGQWRAAHLAACPLHPSGGGVWVCTTRHLCAAHARGNSGCTLVLPTRASNIQFTSRIPVGQTARAIGIDALRDAVAYVRFAMKACIGDQFRLLLNVGLAAASSSPAPLQPAGELLPTSSKFVLETKSGTRALVQDPRS